MKTFLDTVANKSLLLQNRWDFDDTAHTHTPWTHAMFSESLASGDHSIGQNHVVEDNKRVEYQYGVKCSFKNKVLVVSYEMLFGGVWATCSRLGKSVCLWHSDLSFAQPRLFPF